MNLRAELALKDIEKAFKAVEGVKNVMPQEMTLALLTTKLIVILSNEVCTSEKEKEEFTKKFTDMIDKLIKKNKG